MNFLGKYQQTKAENFDEYLQELGVGVIKRKLIQSSRQIKEIQQDEDNYTITTSTSLKKTEIKFKLDEEFDERTDDDRDCKSVITLDGDNKLVQTQNWNDGGRQATIILEFEGKEMKMTMKHGNVVCSLVFTKME